MPVNRVLLLHNYYGWYWEWIEHQLQQSELDLQVRIAHTQGQALEMMTDDWLADGVILCQPLFHGRSITPLLSQIQIELGFRGAIYVIGDRINADTIADLARADVDGLIRPSELRGSALHNLLPLLVRGSIRLATHEIGLLYYRELAGLAPRVGDIPELTARQVSILRAIYRYDDQTDEAIAQRLGIHISTFKRDLEAIRTIFGKQDRLSIGVEAARRGIVP